MRGGVARSGVLHKLRIMTWRSISLLWVALVPFAACRSPSAANAPAEPAIVAEWSGQHGGAARASTRVVRDAAEWAALWRQIGQEAPRALDPARETAVAIFLGERRTGGYAVDGVKVRRKDGAVTVEFREASPAPDAMVTQVISSPWAVVVIPVADAASVDFSLLSLK